MIFLTNDEILNMYISGKSIPDICNGTHHTKSSIRNFLKSSGVLRTRSEAIKLAAKQGKLGSGNRGKKRTFTKEWKENISKSKKGKGKGFSIKPSGYIEITMGENKGRLQHIIIMEGLIGRRLYSNECVHHKDENRSNNNIDNLELMTRSEHAKFHAIKNHKKRNRNSKGEFS